MWEQIDSREPRTRQRAGRRLGGYERAAGAPPQATPNADRLGAAFDALDDIEWRHEAAFRATGGRFAPERPERKDGKNLAVFIAADVDDPPSPAADADKIGLRNLHRVSAASPQLLPAPNAGAPESE
jgi:hypothetical protein